MYKIKQKRLKVKNLLKITPFRLHNIRQRLFLEKVPSETPHRVQNTPLQRKDHNASEKPMALSFTISRVTAINLARKRTSSSLPKILCTLRYITKSAQNAKIDIQQFSKSDKKQRKRKILYI